MVDYDVFQALCPRQNESLEDHLWEEAEKVHDKLCGDDDIVCEGTIDFEKLPGYELFESSCDGLLLRVTEEERCPKEEQFLTFKYAYPECYPASCNLDLVRRYHQGDTNGCDSDGCCYTVTFEEAGAGGLSAGATAAIVLVVLAMVAAACGYWWKFKRQPKQPEPKAAATEDEENIDQDQEAAQAQTVATAGGLFDWWNSKHQQQPEPKAAATKGDVGQEQPLARPEPPLQVSIASGTQDELTALSKDADDKTSSDNNADASLQRKQERQKYLESIIGDIDEKILEKQLAMNSTDSEENKQLLANFIEKKKVEQAGYAKELEEIRRAINPDVFEC